MKIYTNRLTLQPAGLQHSPTLHAIWTNPVVRKFLWDDMIIPLKKVEEVMEINQELFRDSQVGLWLIKKSEQEKIIGFTGLWTFFDEPQPQLLYGLLPGFTGHGFATEAARGVIKYAFEQLEYKYLDAACDSPNQDSIKVAKRLGMSRMKEETKDGKSTVFFRIERNA